MNLDLQAILAVILAIFSFAFHFIIQVVVLWWWLALPFLLWPFVKHAWLWQKQEEWEGHQEYTLLELIPPNESIRSIASMEQVLSNVWSILQFA